MSRLNFRTLASNKGSTLLLVMGIMAFLTTVSLYTMYSSNDNFKFFKKVQNFSDRDLIKSQVELILSSVDDCTLSLKGQAPVVGQTFSLTKPDSSGGPAIAFITKGTRVSGVEVNEIKWTSFLPVTGNIYEAAFEVTLDSRVYSFPLQLVMNAGLIDFCYGYNSSIMLCRESGGAYDFLLRKCLMNKVSAGTCPSGQVLKGFDTSGSIVCGSL